MLRHFGACLKILGKCWLHLAEDNSPHDMVHQSAWKKDKEGVQKYGCFYNTHKANLLQISVANLWYFPLYEFDE